MFVAYSCTVDFSDASGVASGLSETAARLSAVEIAFLGGLALLGLFIGFLLGLEPTPWEWERFVLGHASVARLKAFPIGGTYIFSMRSFNDMEHLPPDLRSR